MLPVCYLDAWWERQHVALEVDGAAHRDVAAGGADLLRANDLAVSHRDHGVLLLRVSAGHLRHDRQRVVEQLRAVLR